MVKDEVFERILENKERAFVLTNSCTPESILTWNDVGHDKHIWWNKK